MSGSKHPYRTAKRIEGAKSLGRTDPPLGVGKSICACLKVCPPRAGWRLYSDGLTLLPKGVSP